MRDIACAQYVAGGNCKFFATGQASGGQASLDTCKNNMMKRLAFADDVGAPYDSMLAFPARAGQFTNGALDTVMCAAATVKPRPLLLAHARLAPFHRSITSRLLPWEVQSTTAPNTHNSFPGGEQVYAAYSQALQLHTIHFGAPLSAATDARAHSRGPALGAQART